MSGALALVEALVSTVARAFYTDTVVVLLEGLLFERYIIEEELGPRLKLSAKDVRRITTLLMDDMLIKTEEVRVGESKSVLKCYYIDYQQFVDVVRYRIHLMQRELVSEEKAELHEVYYQCPTCKTKFTSLEVQRLISADFKFICNSCCPALNFRTTVSEPYYRLVEIDNTGKLSNLQLLERKLEEQMGKSKLHEGIFDLLSQLRDLPLGHNLPSQNISKGVLSSTITDERVKEEIQQNFDSATGQFGGSLVKKKDQELLKAGLQGASKPGFTINIESSTEAASLYDDMGHLYTGGVGSEGAGRLQANASELHASLPHFLRDSRVGGAQEMLRNVPSLQPSHLGPVALAPEEEEGDSTRATKRARVNDGAGVSATESKEDENGGAEGDGDEDVAWEDGSENGEADDVAWEDGQE